MPKRKRQPDQVFEVGADSVRLSESLQDTEDTHSRIWECSSLSPDDFGHNEALQMLWHCTMIYEQAARFFVTSELKVAKRARKATNRDGPVSTSFHSKLFVDLTDLRLVMFPRRSCLYVSGDKISKAAEKVLDVFAHLIANNTITAQKGTLSTRQKLMSLIEEYNSSLNQPEPDSLSSLGYRRHIRHPDFHSRQKLVRRIKRCKRIFCEFADLVLTPADSPAQHAFEISLDVLEDAGAVKEWDPPSSLAKHASLMKETLSAHWPCKSQCQHNDFHIAFASSKDSDILGTYKACVLTATNDCDQATLHLLRPDLTETGTKAKVTVLPRKGKKVQVPSGEACRSWAKASSFCSALRAGAGDYQLDAKDAVIRLQVSQRPALHLRSLRKALSDGNLKNHIKSRERIVLGVILVYTYLHTIDTEFWSEHDKEPDVWFAETIDDNAMQIREIYLRFTHTVTNSESMLPSSLLGWINKNRPSLPALGKLLLEIWHGRAIPWGEIDSVVAQRADDEGNPTSEYWLMAIKTCLGEGADELKRNGNLRNDAELRSIFIDKVVKSLQWLAESLFRRSFSQIISPTALPFKSTKIRASEAERFLIRPVRDIRVSSTEHGRLCLHDGERGLVIANNDL